MVVSMPRLYVMLMCFLQNGAIWRESGGNEKTTILGSSQIMNKINKNQTANDE